MLSRVEVSFFLCRGCHEREDVVLQGRDDLTNRLVISFHDKEGRITSGENYDEVGGQ